MKFSTAFVLSAALAFSAAGCSSPSTAAPKPASCSSFVLTGHPSYPPVAWKSAKTLTGGGIEVVRRLARASGVKMTVLAQPTWGDAQQAVRDGRADAIVGIYKTKEREQYYTYLDPALAPDPSAVVIRAGKTFVYKNWNSLIGKRGVAGAGESYGSTFDAFMAAKLTTYRVPTLADVFAQVLAQKAGYGLSGYYTAITSAPAGIAFASQDFVTEGLYLAFGKQSTCGVALESAFSSGIARMKSDGTIDSIFARELERYEKTHPRPR
ncbi:MAG TPA: transporter substrate-binding domain-containing protein [Candidatus Baltobacteraceae bacterium]|jgi:polar amino acid transport system substrate-binding protein|nr:transporter substrate-binding domain-containing protein [Candidatus Baltobacteraceae bacterium]